MDASNDGLCVLYPATRQYLRLQFDTTERALIDRNDPLFSINVREALGVALAAVTWGKYWQRFSRHEPVVISCWLDNASAVSWFNRRYSANPAGQELVRVLSCAELVFNISFSMAHLPGATNVMADHGSRAWSEQAAAEWHTHMRGWSEQTIRDEFRRIYCPSSSSSNGAHSRTPPWRVYISTWRQWVAFCARFGFSIWLDRHDPSRQSLQLTLFAISCWRSAYQPLRSETIRSKLSHIGWCHRLVAGFTPQLQPQRQLALSGIQRLSPAPSERGAVTLSMLSAIVQAADLSVAQQRVICGLRCWASSFV